MLNVELGVLWDSLYLGSMYYRQDREMEYYEERSWPTDELLRDIEKLKNKIGPLPPFFRTLFFRRDEWTGTLLFNIIEDQGKPAASMEEALSRLDSRDRFFACAAEYFFPKGTGATEPGLNGGEPAAWYRAMDRAEGLPEFVKTDMAYICGNFESFQKDLQFYLMRIYRAVKAEHLSRREEFEHVAEAYRKKENIERLNRFFKSSLTGEEEFENGIGVILMNPYMTCFWGAGNTAPEEASMVICGARFEEAALGSSYRGSDNEFFNFVVACGSENKMRIVYALLETEEMTATQLSQKLSVSTPMAGRYLQDLLDAGIICMSRREGKKVFYSLNREKMRQIKTAAIAFAEDVKTIK